MARPHVPSRARTMRFVPLTGREDRTRLLVIAAQDMSAGYHAALERELDDVARGASCGVCAVDGTTPVGYAVYHRTVQTYHLDTIAVCRSRRGEGIGAALLAAVRAELRQAGPTILSAREGPWRARRRMRRDAVGDERRAP